MRVTDPWQILASWVTLSHPSAFITAPSSYTQEKWLNKHSIREMANISLATNRERDTEAMENRGSLSLAYITTRKCSTQKQSATVGFGFFFPQRCQGDWLHRRAALYTQHCTLILHTRSSAKSHVDILLRITQLFTDKQLSREWHTLYHHSCT